MKNILFIAFICLSSISFSQETTSVKVEEEIQVPKNVGFISEKNQYAFDVKSTKTVSEISISVFSRWGNLIVESKQLLVLWPKDVQNQGTYFVKITGKWTDGKSFEKTAYINYY